jgi:hypothetical protein
MRPLRALLKMQDTTQKVADCPGEFGIPISDDETDKNIDFIGQKC